MGLLLQSLNGLFVPDHFDGVGLCLTAGHELELGFIAEVLEVGARRPTNIDFLDFRSVELVGGVGTFASEFHTEIPEVAQLDGVAVEHLLAEAMDGIGEHAFDGTLGEGRVVVGDVLAEIVEIEFVVNLSGSVGFG